MQRVRVGWVAILGLGLAIGLATLLRPDTGPEPPPAAARPRAHRVDSPPPRPAAPAPAPPSAAPIPRIVQLPGPPDPDRVHEASPQGLSQALAERRTPLLACWSAFLGRAGTEDDGLFGRFTLTVTLRPEAGGSLLESRVSNVDDPDLHACVADALAEARFDVPEGAAVTLLWPVPASPDAGTP